MGTPSTILLCESALFVLGSALIGTVVAHVWDRRATMPDELISLDALIHAPVAEDPAQYQTTTHDHIDIEQNAKHTMKGIALWQLNAMLK
jgi:hypothetical protein